MTNNKGQKIWRKNFSIQNTHYQMGTASIADFMIDQPLPFRGLMKECVWVQEGDNNTASYFLVKELRRMAEHALFLIENKPKVIDQIHRETRAYIRAYFKCAGGVLEKNLVPRSLQELAKIYERLLYFQKIHHAWAIATTWFVDSDGEDLSKLLLKRANDIVAGSDYRAVDVFSALTTPIEPSSAILEELAAWRLVQRISKSKKVFKIFRQKDTAKIEKDLNKLPAILKKEILAHFKKWRWQPFAYSGPAYGLGYYLSLWSGWVREGIRPADKIAELNNYSQKIRNKKAKIIKDLKVEVSDRNLFRIASDIIYLKAYRKDAVFFGMYVLDRLLNEIGKRLSLSIKQVRMMAYWEMPEALRRGYFSTDILNARRGFSVYYQKGKRGVIYTGPSAKKFLAGLNIEKGAVKKVSVLSGTVACPGTVKGRVKIINQPEDMGKMNKSDVMVAHTTFPSLVPAMKKAAAIVTDDGGITCHAAIVSRELKTPCVVGTKIATQVLKDGDLVEVDADKGVVRVIKKK
jgi:phosphohistidine swiveling domain-containing protein